jgi:hypothetical protein
MSGFCFAESFFPCGMGKGLSCIVSISLNADIPNRISTYVAQSSHAIAPRSLTAHCKLSRFIPNGNPLFKREIPFNSSMFCGLFLDGKAHCLASNFSKRLAIVKGNCGRAIAAIDAHCIAINYLLIFYIWHLGSFASRLFVRAENIWAQVIPGHLMTSERFDFKAAISWSALLDPLVCRLRRNTAGLRQFVHTSKNGGRLFNRIDVSVFHAEIKPQVYFVLKHFLNLRFVPSISREWDS